MRRNIVNPYPNSSSNSNSNSSSAPKAYLLNIRITPVAVPGPAKGARIKTISGLRSEIAGHPPISAPPGLLPRVFTMMSRPRAHAALRVLDRRLWSWAPRVLHSGKMHPAVALLSPTAAKMMIIAGVPGSVDIGNFVPTTPVAL
ncbi:uncharacterized protein N7498_002308 [Penicillium cinerascens]|uniref:Uncharacterized protein n=1 Tax=Penicillium cinerascens TaxID=70096 RepID=A0A9W9TB08_9EURO|nr:uncharacterized protein N7498_002308 [Penicillium cinerascens]KAJ5215901.1 hypothetical protein N7498_002308 [Penicillium cinerascens]